MKFLVTINVSAFGEDERVDVVATILHQLAAVLEAEPQTEMGSATCTQVGGAIVVEFGFAPDEEEKN
jgi:hypothetical protein